MEDGVVTIARAAMSLSYPARFMLSAAMNPCPCGYFGDPQHNCVCGPLGVERYLARVSGPLLDRIDIHLEVPAVKYRALADQGGGEPSAAGRGRGCGAAGAIRQPARDLCERAHDGARHPDVLPRVGGRRRAAPYRDHPARALGAGVSPDSQDRAHDRGLDRRGRARAEARERGDSVPESGPARAGVVLRPTPRRAYWNVAQML